jgi:hypothetical protein
MAQISANGSTSDPSSPYQNALNSRCLVTEDVYGYLTNTFPDYCQPKGITPQYQIMTDRRGECCLTSRVDCRTNARAGGRTAWSAAVVIGQEKMNARFWYDGQFVNNAKEDAAQVALIHFRVMPRQGTYPIFSTRAAGQL